MALVLVIIAIGGFLLIADGLFIKAKAADALPSWRATFLQTSNTAAPDGRGHAARQAEPAFTFVFSPLAKPASLPR